MRETKALFFDGKKALRLDDVPEAWTIASGSISGSDIEKLYSTVSWLYRCVSIRGNSVAAMPFEVRKGEKVIYEFDGYTPQGVAPREINWVTSIPTLLKRVEVSTTLGGRAYLERRQNVLNTRAIQFDWLLPTSIYPIYNGVPNNYGLERNAELPLGSLLGFWRAMTQFAIQPIRLETEDVIHFWLPDHAVEIGAAVNYPGRAVLQNAGVIGSMDLFLKGYFDRGMIKATLLKYQNQISEDEKKRVKEWWRRIFTGIANAFSTEVIRGDFDVLTIGEGIKDLRDNALTQDEKNSIAVGLGIPPSKLLPVGVNRATKDGDDRSYIEDTILPEINWIYDVVNKQMLNPLGYSILARPQQLRVMQADENERSQAFRNYVGDGMGNGMPVETAVAVLGIHVPDDLPVTQERIEDTPPIEQPSQIPDELRFIRWLKNRKFTKINVDDFSSDELSHGEKVTIAIKAIHKATPYKALKIDSRAEQYGDILARYIEGAIDSNVSHASFVTGMSGIVETELLSVFKESANIPDNEKLTKKEQAKFDDLIAIELESVSNFAGDLFDGLDEKTVRFDRVRERLQGLGKNLGGRLSAWKNAAMRIWNNGLVFGRREIKLRWELGATEDHCSDCLFLNGQEKTNKEWDRAGILPQSPDLECRGFGDCRLVEV